MSEAAKKLFQNILNTENTKIDFDIDNWVSDFENGFLDYEKTNDLYKPGYWGQGIANRPRIREVNVEGDAQSNQGYRIVEFFPDRDNKDEAYMFFGTPSEIRTQVALAMNYYIMMKGLTIGTYLGCPQNEYVRTPSHTEITLKVFLSPSKQPPFYKRNSLLIPKYYLTIPSVEKSLVTYNALRSACGGNTGLSWGEWTARAYLSLDNSLKGARQMVARGSTKELAEKNIKNFAKFTECKLVRLSVHQIDYTEGNDKNNPKKDDLKSFSVYPAWVNVGNSKLVDIKNAETQGKITQSGKLVSKRKKLYLFNQIEPSDWQSEFNEASQKFK